MSTKAERGILSGLAVTLVGATLLALQCFWSVRAGAWTSLSIVDALQLLELNPMNSYAEAFRAWLNSPESWVTLHSLLDWISLPAVFLTFGLMAVSGSKM